MKNNKSGYFIRGNTLYVQGATDEGFKKYSTGKKATKENERYVAKNSIRIFREIHENKTSPRKISQNFCEYAEFKLSILGRKLRENTAKEYYQIFEKRIKPSFIGYTLSDIKRVDLQVWQEDLVNEGLSSKRINNIRSVFNILLEEARKDELIEKNYFSTIDKEKNKKADITPFSLDEVKLILNNIENCSEKWFIQLAFFSGMRTGEIVGLKWEDINFRDHTITIKNAVRKGVLGDTKTDSSNRTIDILPPVMEALDQMRSKTYLRNSFVFLNGSGTHYHDGAFIRKGIWKRTLQKLGLNYRSFYQTRHTFASIMISEGEDILWVSNMLGHANAQMTLSVYANYIKSDKKRRATFLDTEYIPSQKVNKNCTPLKLKGQKVS
jgi:integrase